jgi:hypothetical protein
MTGINPARPTYMTPSLARWRRVTDGPLIALAVGSLPVLLLELGRDRLPRWDRLFIDSINVIVLIAFAVDYLVELAVAGNRRRYVRSELLSLLVVAAQLVALAPSLAAFGVLRSLRAARLFRFVAVAARAVAPFTTRSARELARHSSSKRLTRPEAADG